MITDRDLAAVQAEADCCRQSDLSAVLVHLRLALKEGTLSRLAGDLRAIERRRALGAGGPLPPGPDLGPIDDDAE
jgi:hypothetical protein